MTLKLHALAKAFRRLLNGRSQNAWIATAARLEREALFLKLDTTEEGLLDREAGDRRECYPLSVADGLTATVLRRDRRSGVPREVAAVFSVRISREGPQKREIPAGELVPGDILELKTGDVVPVDVRLLSCHDFHVDQSAFTGNAFPVRKYAGIGEGENACDFPNIALAGMKVASGTAFAVVIMGGPVQPRTEALHRESGSLSAYGFLVPQR